MAGVRAARRLVVVIVGALLLAAVTAPLAAAQTDPNLVAATDRLSFATPLDAFMAARAVADPPGLDWSSDGCSVPVVHEPERSTPQGFDFLPSCERHDFGYRNQKAQGRFTEQSRQVLDDVFRADMGAVCAQQRGWFGGREVLCNHIADDYYFWVRSCGANPAPYCPLVARAWVDDRVGSWTPPRL